MYIFLAQLFNIISWKYHTCALHPFFSLLSPTLTPGCLPSPSQINDLLFFILLYMCICVSVKRNKYKHFKVISSISTSNKRKTDFLKAEIKW